MSVIVLEGWTERPQHSDEQSRSYPSTLPITSQIWSGDVPYPSVSNALTIHWKPDSVSTISGMGILSLFLYNSRPVSLCTPGEQDTNILTKIGVRV